MKRALFILHTSTFILLAGCTYTGRQTPLQPGEKVIFNTHQRANEFRTASGNDFSHTNRVVRIERPAVLVTE